MPDNLRSWLLKRRRRRSRSRSGPGVTSNRGERISQVRACRLISLMGRKAGVKVEVHPETGKVKYASAHDLRRSFGDRWAKRVMPPVLMQLMRHGNITTTMRYYVGRDAEATAEVLYLAIAGDILGDTPPKRHERG